MTPWKIALPSLVVGPVTYFVTVAILTWTHRHDPRNQPRTRT